MDQDTRIEVLLELDEETQFKLMKLAHEQDITLNEFVNFLLRNHIQETNESIIS